ncbi:MAG: hypothetical protein QW279_09080 [Candidatus Jordarchaeaceae archaeon]
MNRFFLDSELAGAIIAVTTRFLAARKMFFSSVVNEDNPPRESSEEKLRIAVTKPENRVLSMLVSFEKSGTPLTASIITIPSICISTH